MNDVDFEKIMQQAARRNVMEVIYPRARGYGEYRGIQWAISWPRYATGGQGLANLMGGLGAMQRSAIEIPR